MSSYVESQVSMRATEGVLDSTLELAVGASMLGSGLPYSLGFSHPALGAMCWINPRGSQVGISTTFSLAGFNYVDSFGPAPSDVLSPKISEVGRVLPVRISDVSNVTLDMVSRGDGRAVSNVFSSLEGSRARRNGFMGSHVADVTPYIFGSRAPTTRDFLSCGCRCSRNNLRGITAATESVRSAVVEGKKFVRFLSFLLGSFAAGGADMLTHSSLGVGSIVILSPRALSSPVSCAVRNGRMTLVGTMGRSAYQRSADPQVYETTCRCRI